jgi:hypothetical protein
MFKRILSRAIIYNWDVTNIYMQILMALMASLFSLRVAPSTSVSFKTAIPTPIDNLL